MGFGEEERRRRSKRAAAEAARSAGVLDAIHRRWLYSWQYVMRDLFVSRPKNEEPPAPLKVGTRNWISEEMIMKHHHHPTRPNSYAAPAKAMAAFWSIHFIIVVGFFIEGGIFPSVPTYIHFFQALCRVISMYKTGPSDITFQIARPPFRSFVRSPSIDEFPFKTKIVWFTVIS
jgi:hypothetical protein